MWMKGYDMEHFFYSGRKHNTIAAYIWGTDLNKRILIHLARNSDTAVSIKKINEIYIYSMVRRKGESDTWYVLQLGYALYRMNG